MEDKQAILSTTVQGALISFLMVVVLLFKLDVSEHEVTALITGIAGVASLIWTIRGRLKAKKDLKLGNIKL